MFKLHIYSKRTLNSIPPFMGPARRAERLGAEPKANEELAMNGQSIQTISGGAPTCPARRSS